MAAQLSLAARAGVLAGSACGWLLGLALLWFGNGDLLVRTTSSRIALVLVIGAVFAVVSTAGLTSIAAVLSVGRAIWTPLQRLDPGTVYWSIWSVGLLAAHFFFLVVFREVRDVTSGRGIALLSIIAVVATIVLILWNIRGVRLAGSRRQTARGIVSLILVATQFVIGYGAASYLRSRPWHSPLDASPGDLPPASVHPTRPLNVLLISIDTLRSDHLSGYGYRRNTSPYIDALASQGALFTAARSESPWTLPSHATMFTSLYPSIHGARNFNPIRFLKSTAIDHLSERNLTLAEILRAAGYRTTAITSVAWLGRETGMMQGFQSVDNRRKENTATVVVDKAMRVLDRENGPFFLFIHFMDVHDYYSPEGLRSIWTSPSYRGKLSTPKGLRWFRADYYAEVSRADLDYAVARYDSSIRYVDGELGRLFAWMAQRGLMKSTLIVLCADHGEELWDHGGAGHGYALWEEQLRVPLIVHPPASFSIHDHRTAAPAGIIDVTPTILDYLGIPSFPWMQGISLRPAIEGRSFPTTRTFFAESPHTRYSSAIIRGSFKYIANQIPPFDLFKSAYLAPNIRAFYKFRQNGLYRLDDDPGESTNLVSSDRKDAREMQRALRRHILEANPPVGVPRESTLEADQETVEQLRSLGYIR